MAVDARLRQDTGGPPLRLVADAPGLRDALLVLAEALPASATVPVPAGALRELLAGEARPSASAPAPSVTWRERLWTCPDDTRLRVADVAEALGRPRSYVYRATAAAQAGHRLPALRLHGELLFTAEAVRAWIRREETRA